MIHILGLLAEAGNGKTLAADYLQDTYDAKRLSLAGPLKRVAKAVMAFSDEQLYGTQAQKEAVDPRYGMSSRDFMRSLGTEGLREHFWPNVHIDALMKEIEKDDDKYDYDRLYVVDDIRFPNEGEFFGAPTPLQPRHFHTAVIKLICTDAPKPTGDHRSETLVSTIDPANIAATIISSKEQGVKHLYRTLDRVIAETPRLAPFRRLLVEGRARAENMTQRLESIFREAA